LLTCLTLLAGVAAVRLSTRTGMPGLLLFLGIGLALGESGLGIQFDDGQLAFNLATIMVALLLVDGGFTTRWADLRPVAARSGLLASVGVLASVAIAAGLSMVILDVDLRTAILLAAMVSSTDAAAVFAILRRLPIKPRVRTTLEGESSFNDAPAIILVTVVVSDAWNQESVIGMIGTGLYQLVMGAVIGLVIARIGQFITSRASLPSAGLYPIATIAIAMVAFAVSGVLGASGLLAAYIAGLWLGNQALPHHATTAGFAESVGYLAQIFLFVMLGLLASPSQIPAAIVPALVVGSALTFIARPLAVLACLSPFRVKLGEQAFISWAGMRGAVPIMLATIPLTQHLPGASQMFHIVFVLVVTFTLLQGPTLPLAARVCRVTQPLSPQQVMFDSSPLEGLNASLLQFEIPAGSRLSGVVLEDLRLPGGAVLSLVVRGRDIIEPRPHTRLRSGDKLVMAVTGDVVELTQARLLLLNDHGPLARWLQSGRNRRQVLGRED
ncbi:MAG: potassium/proton antiporter, partial [Arachnia sp.]